MAVAERLFAQLSTEILSGRYQPGERLPTQRKLAADLGVTMTALREALKRLEQLGLVEVRHGDAMRVTDWRARGGPAPDAPAPFAPRRLARAGAAGLVGARAPRPAPPPRPAPG